jgi:hypothetical protein
MNMAGVLSWLESSEVAGGIRNSLYLFPLIESLHVFGLATVFGTIAIIDLRLLGLASTRRPFSRVASDVLKWTWAAFGLAVSTGLLMFSTNAAVYFHNAFFRTKMVLLALAGLNMLLFEVTAGRSVRHWDKNAAAPRSGKVAAVVSLILWMSIIFLGRWTGFTTTGRPGLQPEPADMDIEKLLPPEK